jgi:hypothetical protein
MDHSCPFILIHIGEHFPEYIMTCIKQIRLWNPTTKIYSLASECHRKNLHLTDCSFVSLETLILSPKHLAFHRRSAVEGFWKVTTERFFVLEDFMKQYKYEECFHLENDNLIYFSMEDMLPILRKSSKGISAPYLGKDQLSFGVCYVKHLSALEELTTFLTCQPGHPNDMVNGYLFFKENRDITSCLPTCSDICDVNENELDFISEGSESFHNFWDALAYGQFIGGTDPNYQYIRHYVNTNCSFLTSQFEYDWYINSDGLRIPQVKRHGNSWLLYNLHVHCKDLEEFASWTK